MKGQINQHDNRLETTENDNNYLLKECESLNQQNTQLYNETNEMYDRLLDM